MKTPEEIAEEWQQHPARCFGRTNSALTIKKYGGCAFLAGYRAVQQDLSALRKENAALKAKMVTGEALVALLKEAIKK